MSDRDDPVTEHRPPRPELDGVLSSSSDHIRYHSFATSRRGFDPNEVRDYLSMLADWFDLLRRRVRTLEPRGSRAPSGGARIQEASSAQEAQAETPAMGTTGAHGSTDGAPSEGAPPQDARQRSAGALPTMGRDFEPATTSAERGAEERLTAVEEEVERLRRQAEEELKRTRSTVEALMSEVGARRMAVREELRALRTGRARVGGSVDLTRPPASAGHEWSLDLGLDLVDLGLEGEEGSSENRGAPQSQHTADSEPSDRGSEQTWSHR